MPLEAQGSFSTSKLTSTVSQRAPLSPRQWAVVPCTLKNTILWSRESHPFANWSPGCRPLKPAWNHLPVPDGVKQGVTRKKFCSNTKYLCLLHLLPDPIVYNNSNNNNYNKNNVESYHLLSLDYVSDILLSTSPSSYPLILRATLKQGAISISVPLLQMGLEWLRYWTLGQALYTLFSCF